MAKTEIFADEHGGCAQAVDKNAADKLFGRKRGHREIEMENEHSVEAESVEARKSLVECFELRGRAFGTQNAYGMRRESNPRGQSPCAAGAFDDAAQNFLVAEVYAVEIADGENGARVRVESGTPLCW